MHAHRPIASRIPKFGGFCVLVALVWVGAAPVAAAPPPTEDLATLRVQVDTLSAALEEQRDAQRETLTALRAERAELQRQLRLAKAQHATLSRIEAQDEKDVQAQADQAGRWDAPAAAAVAAVRAYVLRSLPFAVPRRLARLDAIAVELTSAQPDVARAMLQLWRFVEEEAAMASEVALDRQSIVIDGRPQLADVLRIGMALLYVRGLDGSVAWAVAGDGGFSIVPLTDPVARTIVLTLVAAHERNEGFGPAELLVPTDVPTEPGSVEP